MSATRRAIGGGLLLQATGLPLPRAAAQAAPQGPNERGPRAEVSAAGAALVGSLLSRTS